MGYDLIDMIAEKSAIIGVVGLGYVGLPLVREFLKSGFSVIGFDLDVEKIVKINRGQSYIKHIDSDFIRKFTIEKKRLEATTDFARIADVDCIIICVPTPLSKNQEPDLSYVLDTGREISKCLKKGHLVVLESTTYPGTTDTELRVVLEKSGLKAGKDFYLAFSPEREDPNNTDYSTSTIPKVVGGYSSDCLSAAKTLYDTIVTRTVPVSSTRVAEASKLLENIYRSINIALVNELKVLFDRMDIDIWEVIEAAKTKPFGFHPFYPGPGLGGHCIPIDPFYLTWKAKEYDYRTHFIELAGEVNTAMPYYVVQKSVDAINEVGRSILGAKILILGLAYKKDIDDPRESPSLKIMQLLQLKGAKVDYNDPHIPFPPKMRKYSLNEGSVPLTSENLREYDIVLLLTDHSAYDPDFIHDNAALIVDTRNFFKFKSSKIKKA